MSPKVIRRATQGRANGPDIVACSGPALKGRLSLFNDGAMTGKKKARIAPRLSGLSSRVAAARYFTEKSLLLTALPSSEISTL
jgi:hypothetical protein